MPKTMTSKFPGTCRECQASVPRGATIVYHGRGLGISCAKCAGEDGDRNVAAPEDEAAGFEPGTLASDRRLARRGLSVIRFSSGATMTRNSRGRCEDAPCCGCCTG